jgi:cobalt-zinc-cadmium efflux system outer membrane protein
MQLRQADADIAVSQAQIVTEQWRAGRAIVSDSERMRALAAEAAFVMQRQRQQVMMQQRECQLLLGVLVAQPSTQPLPIVSDKSISLNQQYSELLRDSADASYSLANKERFPELRVSIGVRQYQSTGDNALVLGAALPLPLFSRNQVALLESQGQQQAAMRRAELSIARGGNRLEQISKELTLAQEQLVVLDKQVLPTTLQSLVMAEASYRAGKTGLSDWLDAKRLWREASERRLSTALLLQETAANLEREFGVQN